MIPGVWIVEEQFRLAVVLQCFFSVATNSREPKGSSQGGELFFHKCTLLLPSWFIANLSLIWTEESLNCRNHRPYAAPEILKPWFSPRSSLSTALQNRKSSSSGLSSCNSIWGQKAHHKRVRSIPLFKIWEPIDTISNERENRKSNAKNHRASLIITMKASECMKIFSFWGREQLRAP